jgi:UDP-2,3-diacylglucosamine pyrophosphatase LpxH
MRTLILSDIHLGSRHCNVELVHEVLDTERFDRLVLNGDTINNVNFRKLNHHHWKLLDRFRALGKERELILIRGNHDHEWDWRPGSNGHAGSSQAGNGSAPLGTGHVLPALLEVPMREDFRLEVGGQPYLIFHGDRFDPTLNYPMLTDVAVLCYQFTTNVNKKLAKWLKKKSKKLGGLLEVIRGRCVDFARASAYTGIVTGHTHYAEDLVFDDIHYLNCGSWTESPCGYVTIDKSNVRLHQISD